MIKLVVCGINGAMGGVLSEEVKNYENIDLIGSLSPRNGNMGEAIAGTPDVVIDFSNPANIDFLIEYTTGKKCALLICTTGFNEEQRNKIAAAGEKIPVMLSSNTSLGINVLRRILKSISGELNSFDIDIVERHHNKKIDAPSGTAKTLAEDIKAATGRDNINTYALRSGTIPGEHVVIFSGNDEILEMKHTAFSKKVFARGALETAIRLYGRTAGYYEQQEDLC